ncbi:MAG: two-component regulator propeller domain-containing protein [Acidobacteriota bacterium]|nr:two-component regulator propeller domain-containing protein [Acidobacteriota bacterium]
MTPVLCLASEPMHELVFEHLSLRQGLSQSTVHCITQDRRGFIWIGTADGLNRYDGYRFQVYRRESRNKDTLSDSRISSLLEDREGYLWVGTFNGLNQFHLETETVRRYLPDPADPNSLPGSIVNGIFEDPDGRIWLALYGAGLALFERASGRFKSWKHNPVDPKSIPDDYLNGIARDHAGILWLATSSGLVSFDPEGETFTRLTTAEGEGYGPGHDYINEIAESPDGTLWLATDGGLDHFDPTSLLFRHYRHDPEDPFSIAGNTVHGLHVTDKGRVWAGTLNGLSWMIQEHKFANFKNDPGRSQSLGGNHVRSIFKDNSGKLWVGSSQAGISILDSSRHRFNHYGTRALEGNRLSGKSVHAFELDSKERLWVGGGSGVAVWNRKTGEARTFTHNETIPYSIGEGIVRCLLERVPGDLWVGTSSGLFRFDETRNRFLRFDRDPGGEGSGKLAVLHLLRDQDRRVWVSTSKGLQRYDLEGDSIEIWRTDPGDPRTLSHNRVQVTAFGSDGELWAGTFNGLNRIDLHNRSVQRFLNDPEDPRSLSHNYVHSLLRTGNEQLWVGTASGLNRLISKGEGFEIFTEKDGLSSDQIYSLIEDDRGRLWMGSNQGLTRYDPVIGEFTNFDIEDGLQSYEFNKGAAYKSADGELFFGGINGYNAFFPNMVEDEDNRPPLVFTDIRVLTHELENKIPLPSSGELVLNPEISTLTLEFAALNFNASANRYSVFLENFHDDWLDLGESNRTTFTNLDPGRYRLKVRARDKHGQQFPQEAELSILVRPGFWELEVVRVLSVLTVVFFVLVLTRMQIRKIKQHNRALVREVTERRRIEKALRESEQRYRTLAELLPLTLFESQLDGRINFFNPEGMRQFRMTDEMLTSKRMLDFVHPEDRKRAARNIARRLEGYETGQVDLQLVRSDGTVFPAVVNAITLREEGKPPVMLGIVFDATELRKVEEEVRKLNFELEDRVRERTEQLEATRHELVASAHKAGMADLATSVLHNIGNILNSVLTSTQIIGSTVDQNPVSKFEQAAALMEQLIQEGDMERLARLQEYYVRITQTLKRGNEALAANTGRLDAQINSIREVIAAQQEYAAGTFQTEDLYLEQVVEDALSIHESALIRRDITITKDFGELPKIRVQKNKLIHIIINLIKNAVEAIGNGSEKRIHIVVGKESKHAEIRVTDTGMGIASENLEKIFNHGFTTKKHGRGFGLHACASAMAEMGGSMRAESEGLGKGATFVLIFPLETAKIELPDAVVKEGTAG